MIFGVITRVPDPEKDDGNLAAALVYKLPPQMRMAVLLNGRAQVFELGEILVLDDEYGREVSGRGRKPSKWDVDCESFSNIEAAVERALAVMNADTSASISDE